MTTIQRFMQRIYTVSLKDTSVSIRRAGDIEDARVVWSSSAHETFNAVFTRVEILELRQLLNEVLGDWPA